MIHILSRILFLTITSLGIIHAMEQNSIEKTIKLHHTDVGRVIKMIELYNSATTPNLILKANTEDNSITIQGLEEKVSRLKEFIEDILDIGGDELSKPTLPDFSDTTLPDLHLPDSRPYPSQVSGLDKVTEVFEDKNEEGTTLSAVLPNGTELSCTKFSSEPGPRNIHCFIIGKYGFAISVNSHYYGILQYRLNKQKSNKDKSKAENLQESLNA